MSPLHSLTTPRRSSCLVLLLSANRQSSSEYWQKPRKHNQCAASPANIERSRLSHMRPRGTGCRADSRACMSCFGALLLSRVSELRLLQPCWRLCQLSLVESAGPIWAQESAKFRFGLRAMRCCARFVGTRSLDYTCLSEREEERWVKVGACCCSAIASGFMLCLRLEVSLFLSCYLPTTLHYCCSLLHLRRAN